jgi:hypothetical protein
MRLCLWCKEKDISDMRADAKYCCPSHRVMASRARKVRRQQVESRKVDESQNKGLSEQSETPEGACVVRVEGNAVTVDG